MSDSSYAEIDDVDPWALNLVVQLERDSEVFHEDLLVAASLATVNLLLDPRARDEWANAISRWHDGRIRKLCRRARGAKWKATAELAHVEVTYGSACVRAFVPCAVDSQPVELSRLQMSGTDLVKAEKYIDVDEGALVVWMNPATAMTSAKSAVQAAHGAQLAIETSSEERILAWSRKGRPLMVVTPTPEQWRRVIEQSSRDGVVVVHDAGFSEVEPGTLTAAAWMTA